MADIYWGSTTPLVVPDDRSESYVPVRVQGASGALDEFRQIALSDIAAAADVGSLRTTSAYAFPTGSVKKEALFAALDDAGHLADLLANQPAVYNTDGTLNDAGYQLQYSFTFLPTDAGALFIHDRYYSGDDAGFAALFAAAGSGSTTPGTVTAAAVVQATGNSETEVMSQSSVTDALAGKPDRYPANPHLPLITGKRRVLDGWYERFFNSGTQHLRPTDGSGGANNGLPDTAGTPSSWQAALGVNVLYWEWRIAKKAGNTARMAEVASQISGNWTYFQTFYTATQIKQGGSGIVNASDDGSLHAQMLTQVHEVVGDANALAYAVEYIPYNAQRFHDPHQTQIDYAVSTPGGTAFKSDPYGLLYFPSTQVASGDGYQNTTQELVTARAALYVSRQATTSTLTAPMKAAMLAYAQNTWLWAYNQARADNGSWGTVSNPPPAAIYFASCYLDPTNAHYRKGEQFTTAGGLNAPRRGDSAYADGMTLAMATLSIGLYRATNSTNYLTEAQAIVAAYVQPNAFGRSGPGGVPLIANARDPWVNGSEVPPYVFADWFEGTAGVPTTGSGAAPLADAIYNTGQVIASSLNDQLSTPDWSGDEYCVTTGYYRWTDDGGAGGQGGNPDQDYGATSGGGQATPRQLMTSSCIASVEQGAYVLEPLVQAQGSSVSGNQGIERVPARVAALELAIGTLMPRSGGYFSDKFGLDTQFYLNRNSNPWVNFANACLLQFDRTSSTFNFYAGGSIRFYTNSSGAATTGAFTAGGSIKPGTDNTFSAGEASYRFSVVYAGSGTINTSDLTEKAVRGALTDIELAAARDIAKSTIVFQFNDAIAEKGADVARLHVGYGAQTVFGIMTAHGLDPHRYAFCCFDEWAADAGEPATEAGPEGSGIFATPGRPARAAGQRYGLRLDELHAFIAAAQEQRLTALETPHA